MQRAFTYYGTVRGQGRPRTRLMGKTAVIYKSDIDREYERMIQWAYEMVHGAEEPIQGPFVLNVKAVIEPPKSAPEKKKAKMLTGYIRPTVKPDVDNIVKAVLDALNGVAFADDKNCVAISAAKYYGTEECINVMITEVEDGR